MYQGTADDFSTTPEQFTANHLAEANVGALGAFHDGTLVGVFLLQGHSRVMWQVHTCILPEHRGKVAEAAAKALIESVFNAGCRKLITLVPSFNRAAKLFALRAGLRVEGNLTASFQKGGVLYDQTILSINKD